jgi:hypothetical protein
MTFVVWNFNENCFIAFTLLRITFDYNKMHLYTPVHTSSRQHNILYLGLDIGPLILHTNSRQGKNAPQILDSNSRQKKILVIESTVTNYESKIQ